MNFNTRIIGLLKNEYLVIGFFTILYLLIDNNNPTVDSWYYAACVKYGTDLFLPHHLLYNVFGWIFFNGVKLFIYNIDALEVLKAMNAVFAGLSLLVFNSILKQLRFERSTIFVILLFVSSSFAFWRFAIENETYILPIFFSLLATYYFLISIKVKQNFLLWSGLFAAIACLFHQIHFFWWEGLIIGVIIYFRNIKPVLLFLLPGLLFPIAYLLVVSIYKGQIISIQSMFQFVFYEYYKGVEMGVGINHLILGIINFIRSFVQLHGNIFIYLKGNAIYFIPLVTSIAFVILAFVSKPEIRRIKSKTHRVFLITIVITFILQFLFAFYSMGNAEFMVMLPMLFILLIGLLYSFNSKFLLFISIAIFSWNLGFYAIPSHFKRDMEDEQFSNLILENPNDLFILKNAQRVKNRIYYFTGNNNLINIHKSAFSMIERGEDTKQLDTLITSYVKNNHVYTDYTPSSLQTDRAALLNKGIDKKFFSSYILLAGSQKGLIEVKERK